jgi:GAF domain-containing protein
MFALGLGQAMGLGRQLRHNQKEIMPASQPHLEDHPTRPPQSDQVEKRRFEGPPSKELDDLTRGTGRLLDAQAFIVSIVGGEEPHPRGETVLLQMAELERQALLYTLCFGVVDGEPLIVEDNERVERERDARALGGAGVRSCLCFPLRANGWQVIGLLCLLSDRPRSWSKAELSLANDLAQLAAIELRQESGVGIYSGNELHLRTRRAVMNGLLSENASERAIDRLLGEVCRNLRWETGSAWFSRSDREPDLECVGCWTEDGIEAGALATLYDDRRQDAGDMLGQVRARQEPVWISDLTTLIGVPRAALAQEAGFRAGLWFPVINAGNAFGVIELLTTQPHPDHDQLPLFALSLGRQIGNLVELAALSRGSGQ